MSTGNANQNTLTEALDSAIAEDTPQGRLEDSEIQRLVALSRDAAYQRSERVPVKTVEAFEPRSLVSIAMEAQRRRETEMRAAAAAGAELGEMADEAPVDQTQGQEPVSDGNEGLMTEAASEEQVSAEKLASDDGDAAAPVLPDDPEAVQSDEAQQPSSTSQIDYEAGRQAGLEEGRQVGFEEGQAKGVEEGRAAGRAEASAQLERAIQTFEAAAAKLTDMAEIDATALSDSINTAIISLASERAGYAISEQPNGLADRVERLLATIQAVSGNPEIRLNEADLASIKPLAETREKLRHCNFVADPDLANGDLSVTLGTIGIDDIMMSYNEVSPPAETAAPADDGPVDEQTAVDAHVEAAPSEDEGDSDV